MKTLVKLQPGDHGMPIDYDDFMRAECAPGYNYEIIYGRVYVTPLPNFAENWVNEWLVDKLKAYSREHPEIANYVSSKPRVFLPKARRVTVPEPDVAVYNDCPVD